MLAITFGLSMDYEVFLLSRIRERYAETGDNARAVEEGLASSARIITSAALIMTTVFASFALTGVPAIKEIGLAWPSRSPSTRPSRGSCWYPRRWCCWASGTGGCQTGSTGSCRTWPTSGPCPSGTPDMLLCPDESLLFIVLGIVIGGLAPLPRCVGAWSRCSVSWRTT